MVGGCAAVTASIDPLGSSLRARDRQEGPLIDDIPYGQEDVVVLWCVALVDEGSGGRFCAPDAGLVRLEDGTQRPLGHSGGRRPLTLLASSS